MGDREAVLRPLAPAPALTLLRTFADWEEGPGPGRAGRFGHTHALGLAPREWLLVALRDGDDAPREVDALAVEASGTTVDITAGRVGLVLSGAGAELLLRSGCTIDLRPRAFGAGACAQTVLGGAPVLIWRRRDDGSFHLFAWRSYAEALVEWLRDAARVTGTRLDA